LEGIRWLAVGFGLYALVRLTLEARRRGTFPLGTVLRGWFGVPASGPRGLTAGFLLGAALVLVPAAIRITSGSTELISLPRDSRWLVLAVASLLLKAAFVLFEETISRGAVITVLDRHVPTSMAVLISAAVFSLSHSARPPGGFVVLGLDGLLFGALFVASGRLWLPAAAHFGKNAAVWLIEGGGTLTFTAGLSDLVPVGAGLPGPDGPMVVELATTAGLTVAALVALKIGAAFRESESPRDSQ